MKKITFFAYMFCALLFFANMSAMDKASSSGSAVASSSSAAGDAASVHKQINLMILYHEKSYAVGDDAIDIDNGYIPSSLHGAIYSKKALILLNETIAYPLLVMLLYRYIRVARPAEGAGCTSETLKVPWKSLAQAKLPDEITRSLAEIKTICGDVVLPYIEGATDDAKNAYYWLSVAKQVDLNDFDVYKVLPAGVGSSPVDHRFLLLVPHVLTDIEVAMALKMEKLEKIEFGGTDEARAENLKLLIEYYKDVVTRNHETLVNAITAIFKTDGAMPYAWNVVVSGHGSRAYDTSSAPITESLRKMRRVYESDVQESERRLKWKKSSGKFTPDSTKDEFTLEPTKFEPAGESGSVIANMPLVQFFKLLNFFSAIPTNLFVTATCNFGGYHAQAAAQLAAISRTVAMRQKMGNAVGEPKGSMSDAAAPEKPDEKTVEFLLRGIFEAEKVKTTPFVLVSLATYEKPVMVSGLKYKEFFDAIERIFESYPTHKEMFEKLELFKFRLTKAIGELTTEPGLIRMPGEREFEMQNVGSIKTPEDIARLASLGKALTVDEWWRLMYVRVLRDAEKQKKDANVLAVEMQIFLDAMKPDSAGAVVEALDVFFNNVSFKDVTRLYFFGEPWARMLIWLINNKAEDLWWHINLKQTTSVKDEGFFVTILKSMEPKLKGAILAHAAKKGLLKIAQFLVDQGADINGLDEKGTPVLVNAVRAKNFELVELLVGKGANLDLQDEEKQTALMYAIYLIDPKIALFLIEKGAELDLQDKEGKTALMDSITYWQVPVLKALVKKGANPALVDSDGKTAFDFAVECSLGDVLEAAIREKRVVE